MKKVEIPTLTEYKNIFKENKEIEGFSDFFRGYIKNTLEETKQEKFKREDFELFYGYNEKLKIYKKIVDEQTGENIDINIVEKFIFGQTKEEFKKFIKKENIELFFGENGIIKTKEELDDLLNNKNIDKIINLIKYGKKENIELFFGENFYNIKTKKELDDLLNNKNIDKIIYLIKNGQKENIELLFGDLSSIDDLISEKFLKKISTNKYIQDKNNILLGDYKKGNNINILELIEKYKNEISENPYLNKTYYKGDYKPFSLIDLKVDSKLSGKQTRDHKYTIGKQTFFDINVKKIDITEEVQLAINRLFAPFFPMTRLIKLVNGKINYVSIDVEENVHGVELNMLKKGISEEINKFFIMIYQFLTIDYDRAEENNIGKKGIIYDFDFIFDYRRNLDYFYDTFDDINNYEEMGEILYTLKDYLTNEVDEVLKYYNQENKKDVVKVFEILRRRLDMLNFSNLIYYNEQVNPKIEEFAKKIDRKYYPIEKD